MEYISTYVSDETSTENDSIETQEIEEILRNEFNLYESKEESIKRQEVLAKLNELVRNFIYKVGLKKYNEEKFPPIVNTIENINQYSSWRGNKIHNIINLFPDFYDVTDLIFYFSYNLLFLFVTNLFKCFVVIPYRYFYRQCILNNTNYLNNGIIQYFQLLDCQFKLNVQ